MRFSRLEEDFISVDQPGSRAAGWLRKLATSSSPLVVTQGGKPAGVLLSPHALDELTERSRFVAAVSDGLADADAGRTHTHASVKRRLNERCGGKSK